MTEARTARYLGQIVAAAIAHGFEHARLHREARRHGDRHLWGWALDVGIDGDSPADACFFVIEAVLDVNGAAYTKEIIELVTRWARSGVPPRDQPTPASSPNAVLDELCALITPHAFPGELAAQTLARVLEMA